MTGIDWVAFVRVLVTALVAAVVTVALFASGVRLLATPGRGAPAGSDGDSEEGETVPLAQRPPMATGLAIAAFAVATAVAVGGVVLIVHR